MRHPAVFGLSIAYILSGILIFFAISQQDRITNVENHVDSTVTQKLDAGKVCREGAMSTRNCRALIDRIVKAATAKQEHTVGLRLFRTLTSGDLRRLGIQDRPRTVRGDTGNAGARGTAGATGSTGAQGSRGTAGSKGESGSAGASGAKGDRGERGPAGAQGPQGPPGSGVSVGDVVAAVCARLPPGLCR